ncbi:MAG: helix-turn-helix transcriptional regulator [Pseudomonadota bacterium]
MRRNNLAENLRMLCGHYRSVAEVCRRVGINRQQFNKYLSGASQPSVHTLRRLCDFFGLDESEILLPTGELSQIVALRREPPAVASALSATIEKVATGHGDSQQKLQRYCGYYAAYMCTPAYPGRILRYLQAIYQKEDHTYGKAIERLVDKSGRPDDGYISKYLSLVLHSQDRIYLFDHSPQSHQVFALSVLYPSHRTRLHLLTGLGIAVSGGPGRQAFATRMVFEYLGETTDLRAAVAACGLYPEDSDQIEESIRLRVKNQIGPGENALMAVEF